MWADGQPVTLTSPRLRTLLVVLAISANRSVSVDRLAAAVWPAELPCNPASAIQTYVSRLRSTLGAAAVTTTASGYALNIAPDDVDAIRFLRLLDAAAVARDPVEERQRLGEALALWRGSPFEGIASAWLEESEAPQLEERYLAALERRIDLDAAKGRSKGELGELAAELREIIARYPLRESLWVRLMVLLQRAGRQAEALQSYEVIRARIADELGVDPSRELQQVYAELLSSTVDSLAVPSYVVPRQLPGDVAGFVGRTTAISLLDSTLSPAAGQPHAVRVAVIIGPAGLGKTALAVHWAHRHAGRFPDGQLYVDLRGSDSTQPAMTPSEALRGFLEALGVRPDRIPSSVEAQASLYRSLLADKRVLVVLDDARDADQIKPLLPGSSGCFAVVTSRDDLSGLVAATGARPLVLEPLTSAEAWQLLVSRLGTDRLDGEPEAVDDIIDASAGLPLALASVAAWAATHPNLRLGALATGLRRARARGIVTIGTDFVGWPGLAAARCAPVLAPVPVAGAGTGAPRDQPVVAA